MEVRVDTSAPSLAKVSLVVPAEEFGGEYSRSLRSVGRRVRLNGFRPGKVPLPFLEKQFGDGVRREVMESFLRKAYERAMEEHGLKALSHPRVSNDSLALAEDGSFELEFQVGLKPSFELPDYMEMSIDSELEPVLPDQVDQVVADLRRQESVPEPAGEDGIGEDGLVVADLVFVHEDEAVFEREGLRLSGNTPPPGVDPEKFGEALAEAKVGARIEVDMVIPPDVEKEEARGQAGQCRLEVREAFRLVPPADEDFYAMLEVEDEEALQAKVRERLGKAARQREDSRIESVLLDRLIRELDVHLPEPMVEEQTGHRLDQLAQQMKEHGVPDEKIEEQVAEQAATAREEAEKGMRALLLVEALGEREGLLVTDEDIQAELTQIAERNQATLDEVRQYYAENNLGQQMAVEVLERKVRRFLRENARIEEPA